MSFLSLFLLTTGCRTISKDHGLVADAKIKAMRHEIWTRPTEVGFKFDREIEGVAESTKFLGLFQISGDPTSSFLSFNIFGGNGLSNEAKYAASTAIEQAGGDGIYILFVEEEKINNFFVTVTKTRVRGKMLKLETYGPVDIYRVDGTEKKSKKKPFMKGVLETKDSE